MIGHEEQERFAIINTRGAELQATELHKINEPMKIDWLGVERKDTAKFYTQRLAVPANQKEARHTLLTFFKYVCDDGKHWLLLSLALLSSSVSFR